MHYLLFLTFTTTPNKWVLHANCMLSSDIHSELYESWQRTYWKTMSFFMIEAMLASDNPSGFVKNL